MLEDRSLDSCLISRVFLSSRLSESNWSKSYMYPEDDDASENKLNNGKRALEVAGEIRQTKSIKLMGFSIKYNSDSSDYYSGGEEQADAVGNGDGSSRQEQEESDSTDNGGDSSDYSLSGGEGQADADIGDGSSEQEQDPSDSNQNGGDSSDSHSLINEIGRDNSIDCMIRCSRSDYGSIASLNRNFRSLVKSGEIYRLRRQNGFVEHWVYFSCQLLEWVAFDPVERRWMELPTMPSSVTFMCADKESLAVGTDLLVLGKDDFSSHVIYRYSLLTNSWSSSMKMNSPRCLFGSASLGEIAIFAGGCGSQGKILDFAEMYNSELQTWITLPRMNKPRKMCSGVFMDGKFYVIGGIGGTDSKVLTCGEEYDLETKKWTQVPDLSPPRSRADQADMSPAAEAPPLVAVVNNQLYAADHADMEVRKYDKENKKWLTVGRLPERAGSVNGWGLAFRACGERLIVIGGPKYSGGGFIELNSWIPSEGGPPQWTLLDRKHSSNFVYNCAVMGC